jgi:hypothetical protein
MPSLLPVLLHDRDLPEAVRSDLLIYGSSPRDGHGWAARRRAAVSLQAAFNLDESEISALLAVDDPCALCAA